MVEQRNRDYVEEDLYGEEDEDTQKDKYLTFQLAAEVYGIEIRHVTEIIGIQRITRVPDMPGFLKGVINLRGQVIPVMDVRARFQMPGREYDDRTCVIVVRIDETSVGLIVDTVCEVATITEENVSEPPRIAKGNSSRYIQGIGKAGGEVRILLDAGKLLYEEEVRMISEVTG